MLHKMKEFYRKEVSYSTQKKGGLLLQGNFLLGDGKVLKADYLTIADQVIPNLLAKIPALGGPKVKSQFVDVGISINDSIMCLFLIFLIGIKLCFIAIFPTSEIQEICSSCLLFLLTLAYEVLCTYLFICVCVQWCVGHYI